MARKGKLLFPILFSLAAGSLWVTCSSSNSSTPAASGPLTSCAKNDLNVVFSPMYSAYISSAHQFQVPAVVNGIAPSAVTWGASDKTMVGLAQDPTTGGTMITMLKPGTVSIIASAGTLCGASTLTITAATEDDWAVGNARYNDGVVLTGRLPGLGGPGRPGGGAGGAGGAGATEVACTNCHGDTATAGPYKTVSHTPEQTGGFSDAQLLDIFMNGTFPGGAKDPSFDATIVSYQMWQGFHKWAMTPDEAKGIIVYLRSLTPQAQTGAPNFGGQFDGGVGMGMRDGGFGMREGGMGMREAGGGGPPPDGGIGAPGDVDAAPVEVDAATD